MTRQTKPFEVYVSGSDLHVIGEIEFVLTGMAKLVHEEVDSEEIGQAIRDNIRYFALRTLMDWTRDS